ncbi:hypothetical protein ACJX0J_011309, partial [Zea mays]
MDRSMASSITVSDLSATDYRRAHRSISLICVVLKYNLEQMKDIDKRTLAMLCLALANSASLEDTRNSIWTSHSQLFNKAVLDYQNMGSSMDNDHLAILFLCSFLDSYGSIRDQILYGTDSISMDDITSILMSGFNHVEGEGLSMALDQKGYKFVTHEYQINYAYLDSGKYFRNVWIYIL